MSLFDAIEQLLKEMADQQRPQAPVPRPAPRPMAAPRRLEPVVEAEVIEADVATHVSRHIDTGQISQHTAALGAEVGRADTKAEARVHRRLDHDLTKLDDGGGVAARGGESATAASSPKRLPSAARDLAELLRNPKNLRQAILLNEILHRPEHRW